jgi:hypothetical protein
MDVYYYFQGQSGKHFEHELHNYQWMHTGGAEYFWGMLPKLI